MAIVDLTSIMIAEGSTSFLSFAPDGGSEDVSPDDLETLELTLYDELTGDTINELEDADILEDWTATVNEETGVGRIEFAPEDNIIVGTREVEVHRAMVKWTWNSGKTGITEFLLAVANLSRVPS